MSERLLTGTPASPGAALGRAWHLGVEGVAQAHGARSPIPVDGREAERERAVAALAQAAEALTAVAAGLAPEEAEIVDTGALMAQDPMLIAGIEAAVLVEGLTAQAAILQAINQHADAIAGAPR